jgi:hypothetical protein
MFNRIFNKDSDVYLNDVEICRIIKFLDRCDDIPIKVYGATKFVDDGRQLYGQVWEYHLNTNIRYPSDNRIKGITVNASAKTIKVNFESEEFHTRKDFNSRLDELKINGYEIKKICGENK